MYRFNLSKSGQGHTKIGDRLQPPQPAEEKPPTETPVDEQIERYLNPVFETLVADILREVEDMRYNGTLEPFREGQQVGVLPRRVRKRQPTKKQLDKEHNRRAEDRRAEMLALRKKNDAAIASLLGRIG